MKLWGNKSNQSSPNQVETRPSVPNSTRLTDDEHSRVSDFVQKSGNMIRATASPETLAKPKLYLDTQTKLTLSNFIDDVLNLSAESSDDNSSPGTPTTPMQKDLVGLFPHMDQDV